MSLDADYPKLEPVLDWLLSELCVDPWLAVYLSDVVKKPLRPSATVGKGYARGDLKFAVEVLGELGYVTLGGPQKDGPKDPNDIRFKLTGKGYLFALDGGFGGARQRAEVETARALRLYRVNLYCTVATALATVLALLLSAVAYYEKQPEGAYHKKQEQHAGQGKK